MTQLPYVTVLKNPPAVILWLPGHREKLILRDEATVRHLAVQLCLALDVFPKPLKLPPWQRPAPIDPAVHRISTFSTLTGEQLTFPFPDIADQEAAQ
jgi:hypothetical protein